MKGKKAKQIGSLYSTMMLGMVVGVGNSIVNTRFLGPEQYGDFRFLIHLFNFVVMFLTVGIFFSGGRLLAQDRNRGKEPRLSGAMLTYGAVLSILMIIGFFIFSFFEERIYDNNLGSVIRLFSPFLFIFPLRLCMESIMTGSNEIYKLSAFRLFPKFFYLAMAVLVNFVVPLSLNMALLLNLSGFGIIIIIMLIKLKPQFRDLKPPWQEIRQENKSYGFPVYISHLSNTATTRIAALSIAFFIDNTNVGFFALAVTITAPLAIIPRVVGTTFFRDFANRDAIPGKATAATVVLGLGAMIAFMVLIKFMFFIIYTKDFAPALP
ncbi:MAG: oligosaccharide flippase family protein, partial [bacterium]|nr:oligosaccharide flippase family protein [bacterium]